MVNTLDTKIEKAAQRVKDAKDPIELEDAQTQLDNLLDIRLAQMAMAEKEAPNGD